VSLCSLGRRLQRAIPLTIRDITYLPDDGGLKYDQHEQGEERVVPVLIQAPKSDTENLENEEGGDGVFLEKLSELGQGNVESIEAISGKGGLGLLFV